MSSLSSPTLAPSPSGAETSQRDRLLMLLLAVAAAMTRLPLISSVPGEADCARFLVGLRQWTHLGPHAPVMYGAVFSPLYYWLAAHLAQSFNIAPLHAAGMLNAVSALATMATAPVAYALGRRFLSARIAFWSTLAFLATPAYWWLGIETHPQALSLLGFLIALLCLAHLLQSTATSRGRAALLMLASIAALTAGLGFKSDLILLFPAFPALLPILRPDLFPSAASGGPQWAHIWRRWLPALTATLLVPACASVLFLLLRSLLLQRGFVWLQHDSGGAVAAFLEWPRGGQLIKQLLPMATAFGLLVALVAAFGALRALLRRWSATWRLALLAAAWSLPSFVFWFLIRGNNVRHMADVLLPLLWLGIPGWEDLRGHAVPVLVASALILDLWGIPASSNVTLYPSANVPGSAHDLRLRLGDLEDNLQAGLRAGTGQVCYLGNATLPYLELFLWEEHPEATLRQQHDAQMLRLGDGRTVFFIEVNSSPQYRRAAAQCRPARSLEYAPDGAHLWFLGQEWASLPFHQRWYALRYSARGQ